jgi:hypothetical protein
MSRLVVAAVASAFAAVLCAGAVSCGGGSAPGAEVVDLHGAGATRRIEELMLELRAKYAYIRGEFS